MSNPELRAKLARERRRRRAAPTPLADRLGPAALGLFAGLVLGGGVAVATMAWRPGMLSTAQCVFGGAALGALLGAVSIDAAFGLVEGLLHFLAGMVSATVSGMRDDDDLGRRPTTSAAGWRHALFWAGVAVAIGLAVLLHWH